MATKTTQKDHKRDDEKNPAAPGKDAEAETVSRWVPASWPGRIWADVRATGWRARRQLLPHAIAGGVAGTGLAAHAIAAHGAASPAQLALLSAGVGFPAVLGLAKWTRKRKPRWTKRVLIAGVFAAGWLTAAPYGVGPEQAAALITAEYALGARWWQQHRLGYPTPGETSGRDDEQELGLAEQFIADYATYAAAKGKVLEGSALMNPTRTKHTIAFDLRLSRGSHSISTLYGALGKLATALDVNVQDLVPERHPRRKDAWARLQIVIDSPIAGDVKFTGPRRDGGLLRLGPYADGDGEVPYKLYTPGSMWSGVVIGGTGIGKSRIVENIVISAISGGDTVYWYLDPQNGTSSPSLAEHADWFATLDNADAMLMALLAIVDARSRENAALGLMEFTPSPERPGLLAVLEECHAPLADPNKAKLWARIAREGRKVGVAFLLISQYPGLETFGGQDPMRSNVMAGNAIVLRTLSNTAKGLMPGLQIDPKTLPEIPGYGYVLGNDPAIGLRTAPWRNRDTGKNAGDWIELQPMPELDRVAATATLLRTTAYRDRHEISASAQETAAAFIEALRRGELPDAATLAETAVEEPQEAAGDLGNVIKFPGPITPAVQATEKVARERQASAQFGDSHRAVLGAVASGIARPSEIAQVVKLSQRRVQGILADLLNAGYVTKTGAGPAVQYQPAA